VGFEGEGNVVGMTEGAFDGREEMGEFDGKVVDGLREGEVGVG